MKFEVSNYFEKLKKVIDILDLKSIEDAIKTIRDHWEGNRQIFNV